MSLLCINFPDQIADLEEANLRLQPSVQDQFVREQHGQTGPLISLGNCFARVSGNL